jgi:methionine-S-sulfoxide reductase
MKAKNIELEEAMFGAGCFWGVEEEFRIVPGVIATEVGYAGGEPTNVTYEEVCAGGTGHTEVVKVAFDPKKITYKKLLEVFFGIHDPTQINRQGPDVGYQYRSVIFYFNEKQKKEAERFISSEQKRYARVIATTVEQASTYCRAEEYHQKYIFKGGKAACKI